MTVRYLHVRACDQDGNLLHKGGLTVAYTANESMGMIAMGWAKCHDNDNFCYRTGRAIASGRLKSADGQPDIVDFVHPISEQVRRWVADVLFNGGITLIRDPRRRTLSTFDNSWQFADQPAAEEDAALFATVPSGAS